MIMGKRKENMGDILLEHERVLLKMVDQGLQWGDILNLTRGYLEVHCPNAQEQYTTGGSPVFYYGPESETKNTTGE